MTAIAESTSQADNASTVRTRLRRRLPRVLRDPFGRIGASLLFLLALFTILTPLLSNPNATRIQPARKLLSPALWSHHPAAPSFGTDHLGRNLGVMTALGVRTSLVIGLSAVALAAMTGWLVGGVSGFVGGRLDDLGGRLMDFFSAFPGLLLVIALVTALGSSLRNVIIVLAIATWDIFGRVARAAALALREASFVDAARVSGVSLPRMMLTHVRLNTSSLMAALVVIEVPRLILAEATLSFLGFGLGASQTSLGSLIASERDSLQVNAWAVTFPGIVLSLMCVGLSLFGLGLRNSMGVPTGADL
jgi:peptide/nickel transport system permease protein